jgi:hypothetical protein
VRLCQVWIGKANVSEPPRKCRKRMDDVKTGEESLPRDQRWGDPLTASVASGIKVARVRFWLEHGTWEPVASMPREKPKWRSHEGQSTDAGHRGGLARSSVEVSVMGMERRGQITQSSRGVNQVIGRNPAGRRSRWPGDKSRMSREAPVRFREGLGVKFPRATRLVIGTTREEDARRIMEILPERMSQHGLTVHPEKTRLVRFQPPPTGNSETEERDSSEPRTFDFLGFTHYWGRSQRGAWVIKRKTAKSRFKRALSALSEWCQKNLHLPIREQYQKLTEKLRGHYGYYGIIGNFYSLLEFRETVRGIWRHGLSRRRRDGAMTWAEFTRLEKCYCLPRARGVHGLRSRVANS